MFFSLTSNASTLDLSLIRSSGEDDLLKAILYITGNVEAENLSNETIEKFYYLSKHPLKINLVPMARLFSSGLFSHYQAASFYDYKETNGDVLSFAELSYLDGFNSEYVAALRFFISLETFNPILKQNGKRGVSQELMLRFSDRLNIATKENFKKNFKENSKENFKENSKDFSKTLENTFKYGLKYALNFSDKYELKLSTTTNFTRNFTFPEIYNFSFIKYGRRHLDKLIIGDFNMKLGQGIAFWSGFAMSSFYSADACDKRGAGLSSPWSFTGTGTLRGLASVYSFGRFTFSSGLALPGLRQLMQNDSKFLKKRDTNGHSLPFDFMPIFNLTYYGHNGQIGFSSYNISSFYRGLNKKSVLQTDYLNLSLDCRYNFRGVRLFSEVAYDFNTRFPAALAGTVFTLGDNLKIGIVSNCSPLHYKEITSNYSKKSYGKRNSQNTKRNFDYRFTGVLDFHFGNRIPLKGKTGFGNTEFRHFGTFSVDYKVAKDEKIKLSINYNYRLNPSFSSSSRFVQTFVKSVFLDKKKEYSQKSFSRSDLRCDLKYISLPWQIIFRNNIVLTSTKTTKEELYFGYLTYVESGYTSKSLISWFRLGYFNIPTWNERIYAYSREAPSNFYVPAYYGKGFWISTLLGWKRSSVRKLQLYLKSDVFLKDKFSLRCSLQCYYNF